MIQINNKLRDRCYQIACDHGFHDKEYSDEHWLMLIITEMSEAVDADRNGRKANVEAFERMYKVSDFRFGYERLIKGSVEEELSDIVIRCLDFCGLRNLDISDAENNININSNQKIYMEYFHAKPLTTIMFNIVREITIFNRPINIQMQVVITKIFCLAKAMKIDLLWHIEQKMKYNELRPMLNGKKY